MVSLGLSVVLKILIVQVLAHLLLVGIAYLLAFESANNLAMSPAENIEYDRWVPHVRGAGAARAVISVAKIGPGKVGRTCRACSRMCGSGQRPICSKFFKLIENEYLGLKNGILDQSAILLSSYGCLTCMNCKGLKQALTSNPGYNHRVAECQAAARFLLK
ncbi:unnamed protein product [Camellia sinensis]